jgi:hypothetical protein
MYTILPGQTKAERATKR